MARGIGNLVDLLMSRVDSDLGYTFVSEEGEDHRSHRELDRRARAIAGQLAAQGLAGERVLLVYPPGLDYVEAFFGCLYAAATAVPVFPPDPARLDRTLPRLTGVASDAQPSAIMTTGVLLPMGQALAEQSGLPAVDWIASDTIPGELADSWQRPTIDSGTVALIQYTSGSTTAPKGVVLAHRQLLHNSGLIQESFGTTPQSRGLSWLPLYHDMGLIGGVLQPLFVGFPMVLTSPTGFLADPLAWLETISRLGITASGGPNFAYDLCVRRFDPVRCEGLDLSRWTVAFNGAEPVRSATIDQFTATFAPYGFRASTFLPCYGLAEATLIVTGQRTGREPRRVTVDSARLAAGTVCPVDGQGAGDTTLVSSGTVLGDQQLAIVDPNTGEPCADDVVGEITVHGPSVAEGYWREPGHLSRAFVTDTGQRWLRTGDLGFVRGGELFVTARKSDLIIVRGRNIYPQDLEQSAVDAGIGIRPGCAVAFGAEIDGEERVVLVGELSASVEPATAPAVAGRVRESVLGTHDVSVHEVVLIRAGTIAKTSSGKLQRGANRQRYLDDALEVVYRHRSPTQPVAGAIDVPALRSLPAEDRAGHVSAYLTDLLARATGVDPTSLEAGRPLDSVGLDSLASVQLLHTIETELGVELPLRSLLGPEPIAAVAELVARRLDPAHPAADGADNGQVVAAPRPASADGPRVPDAVRGLWFLHRLAPDSTAYHLVRAFTVGPGKPLDPASLDRALCLLLSRHEALRLTYPDRDGEPVAVPTEPPARFLQVLEVDAGEVDTVLAAGAAEPFDLARGPLIRAQLIVPDTGPQVLLVAAHHLVLDLWSASVLVTELRTSYPALEAGQPVPLAAAADYGRAARRLVDAWDDASRDFWHGVLAGALPVLEIPDPRPRPPVQTFVGATIRHDLSSTVSTRIRQFAQAARTTPYVVLLSAFQVLLHRYTGHRDILVGSPVALRRHPETAGAVGHLLNMVVLRANLGDNPSFARLLERNRTTVAAALDNREYPFARLVEELVVGRDPSHAPVFQVMFAFEQAPGGEGTGALAVEDDRSSIDIGGVTLVPRRLERRAATADLALRVAESAGRLVTCWEYNTDVVASDLVARMADHFALVLDAATRQADRRIGAIPLVSRAQAEAIRQWNATEAPVPAGRCLTELILETAAGRPAAIAIRAGQTALTYGDLVSRATALAGRLRDLGVRPETRVAIYLRRSPEAVVAILATLIAGGAYVALDPANAPTRLRHILDDARAQVIITDRGLRPDLADRDVPVVRVDAVPDVSGPDGLSVTTAGPALDNLAYVTYTSGSTGGPKGIEVSHANLLSSTHARLHYFPDRVTSFLLISSLGFDSSVAGLFRTLYEGGTLVLPDPDRDQDPAHHLDLLRRHQVSHFESVPSLYLTLLNLLRPGDLPALRSVVVAGEACPRQVYDQHRELLPHAELVNEYGPAEATVWCSAYRAGDRLDRPHLPIGRPVANYRLHLLDGYGHPTPPGAVGEIHIGGVGVARGYLGQPDLTAAHFLPDPFAGTPGARMYRSGDLARMLPDGDLEFVGRADNQLKIRGVRVELGEVEAALRTHPDVREAVVRPIGAAGDLALVAYLVPAEPDVLPDNHQLRRYLRERVLTAMVPAGYVWLPALPLTAHGKVDHTALPTVELPTANAGEPASGDHVADLIAGLFADLLDLPGVGTDDDFFDLGGHSLLVTQLVSRLRAVFRVEVEPRSVFTAPTVGLLTAVVREKLATPGTPTSRPRRRGDSRPVPLSYTQQRLWFINELLPENVAYNIPVAVALRGPLDRAALAASLCGVADRHEALRTTFQVVDAIPVQRVREPADVELTVHEHVGGSDGDGSAVLHAALAAEARRPFDLAAGPLWRATLFRVAPQEHVLMVVLHHIIADGWSLAVLTEELATSYAALSAGQPDPVPAPAIQYPDFAVWQREELTPESMHRQLDYWLRQLADAQVLSLAPDRPRPAVQTFAGATASWQLDAPTTDALQAVARRADATLFMVLLGAFGLLLGRHGHADDVVIGSPVSGRTHVETEGLIGFFANTLPLRLDLTGDPSFATLTGRVREVCLDAYLHQDVPFGLLVESLRPTRDLGRNPLFQVVFALQNAPRPTPRLGTLDLKVIEVTTATAKFDLTVSLWQDGDQLRGTFEYNRDLFEPATVATLGADFTRLLRRVAVDPQQTVAALYRAEAPAVPLMVAAPAGSRSVTERFAEQVERRPAAVAVSHSGTHLTYAELAARVAALTDTLTAMGAGPGTGVGLGAGRSIDWLVSLLAVMCTGATCVTLDPDRSSGWRERVLADSGASILVGRSGPVLIGPTGERPAHPSGAAWLGCSADGTSPAMAEPRELAERIQAIGAELAVTDDDRILSRAPLCTERALWEALLAVTTGAELTIPPTGQGPAPTVGLGAVAELDELIGSVAPRSRILCLGERPPTAADLPDTLVFVPESATMPVATGWTRDGSGRWIGRPLTGTALVVLDRFGQPLESGVPGHLHVSGLAPGGPSAAGSTPIAQGAGPWQPTGLLARDLGGGRLQWLGLIGGSEREPDEDVPFVAPRTAVERVLAAIWADLLKDDDIGVLDDFFGLGGHSLLAAQIIAEVTSIFQTDVPVLEFFENPSIARLAAAITARERQPGQAARIAEIWQRIRAGATETTVVGGGP